MEALLMGEGGAQVEEATKDETGPQVQFTEGENKQGVFRGGKAGGGGGAGPSQDGHFIGYKLRRPTGIRLPSVARRPLTSSSRAAGSRLRV